MAKPSGKEIYERRMRAKAEMLMRREENALHQSDIEEDSNLLLFCIGSSLDRIATALEKLAEKTTD